MSSVRPNQHTGPVEPVTVALMKLGAGAIGKALGGGAGKVGASWWARQQLARDVVKGCEFAVPAGRLRKVLRRPDFFELVAPSDAADADRLSAVIVELVGPARGWSQLGESDRESRAAAVALQVRANVLRRADPSGASQVLDRRADARHQEVMGTLEQQSFERRLAALSLPPYLADEVSELRDRVPRLVELLEVIDGSDDPPRRLVEWLQAPPGWFGEVPGAAWEVLGHALSAYGQPIAAAEAYLRAASDAVEPALLRALAAYHLSHGALLSPTHDVAEADAAIDARVANLLAGNTAPVARWLSAALGRDWPAARDAAEWLPATTSREQDLRTTLLSQTLWLTGEDSEAERLLRAQIENTAAAGPLLLLAVQLRSGALRGQRPSRMGALVEAVDLALRARARRRRWRGDSAEAAIHAVEAAWLLDDFALVRRTVTPAPDGEATAAEVSDPRVVAFRGMLAALDEDADGARALVRDLDDFPRLHVEALLAGPTSLEGPLRPEVLKAWEALWDTARSDPERLLAARGLALNGRVHANLHELRGRDADAVAEVEQLADLARPRKSETVRAWQQRLREGCGRSLDAARQYGQQLATQGKPRQAAQVWSDAADRFDDQSWRLRAAVLLHQADQPAAAQTTAEAVLTKTNAGWAGRRRAHEIALESSAQLGRWPAVIGHARALLALDDTVEVRWVLAHALAAEDDIPGAWRAVTPGGRLLEPILGQSNRWQTELRVRLARRCGSAEQLLDCAVDALRRYGDDQPFAAGVIQTVFLPAPPDDNPSPHFAPASDASEDSGAHLAAEVERSAVEAEFARLVEEFQGRFPDSPHLRAITFDDPDDPEELIAKLTPLVKDRAVVLQEAWQKVRYGEWPFGVLALAASRRYAETYVLTASQGLLIRTADPTADALDENDITASVSARQPVLLDATTLYVLNVLNADARSACLSAHSTLQVTRPTLDDLKATRDQLAVRGTMSVGYDTAAERLVATEIAPETAAAHAATARRLLELATTSATVVAAAKPTRAPQARDIHAETFLGLLETCKADGQALWSDDPVLRAIARAEGMSTFAPTPCSATCAPPGRSPRPTTPRPCLT